MSQSIIYFARHFPVTTNFEFKIGESGRGLKRQKDNNFPQNFIINEYYVTPIETKSYRLLIESWLRYQIENNYNCKRIGTDTFVAKDYKTVLKIKNRFLNMCKYANNIIQNN